MNLWDSLNFPSTVTSSEYTKAVKQQLLKIIEHPKEWIPEQILVPGKLLPGGTVGQIE